MMNFFALFYRNWNGYKRRKSVICVQSDLWVGTNYSYLTPFIFPNSWLRAWTSYSISFDAHRSYGLCGTGIQLYLWYVHGHWVRNSLILSKKVPFTPMLSAWTIFSQWLIAKGILFTFCLSFPQWKFENEQFTCGMHLSTCLYKMYVLCNFCILSDE